MKIQTKILTGFGIIGLILAGSITFTAYQVSENVDIHNQITSLRVPTAMSGLKILNGVNHSLAALRGWIILGKDKFVEERKIAWTEIDEALGEMHLLSADWTDQENKARLSEMNTLLKEFYTYQLEIESIANTPEHRPDLKMLFEEAVPKAAIMSAEITNMINQELTEESTLARKELFGMMADVRGTLGLGLANIRAYLFSGDVMFRDKFTKLWEQNGKRFADLKGSVNLLKPAQKKSFDKFSAAREKFDLVPPIMFEIRGSDEYDLANYWLGSKAAPAAFKIKALLSTLIDNQHELLTADAEDSETSLLSLLSLQWVLLGIGLCLCALVGIYLGRAISIPVHKVVRLTDQMNKEFTDLTEVIEAIANNDLSRKIEITEFQSLNINSKDEIGQLVKSIEGTLEAKSKISKSLSTMVVNLTKMILQLETNAGEKEILLKEIHHRVKNNLQVISSLLHMQAESIQDEKTSAALLQSQSRINSMSLIHEQLYMSSDLASINLREYIESLAKGLFASYGADSKQLGLEIEVGEISMNIDTASSCGLIISELISNSIKHAFPDGRSGKIVIEHWCEGDMQTLCVRDTGIGMPPERDRQPSSSLGLQLVNLLTKQLDGSVEIIRDQGTSTRIRFPREKETQFQSSSRQCAELVAE